MRGAPSITKECSGDSSHLQAGDDGRKGSHRTELINSNRNDGIPKQVAH